MGPTRGWALEAPEEDHCSISRGKIIENTHRKCNCMLGGLFDWSKPSSVASNPLNSNHL
jgi:hypothetical protein|tara:strand:+ start:300 stop:476 length:177 start_codon:yes stop_codon:yes gene_type:complete